MRDMLLACSLLVVCLPACGADEGVTVAEARSALEESQVAAQAATVADGSVEISTHFTIGMAVEAAALQLRDFVASQLPCAKITLAGATLTVAYGAQPGACTYKGQTFSGKHVVTVMKSDGEVVVSHSWEKLSNGRVEVSGTAMVTWSAAQASRHVVHQLHWTRLGDQRMADGSGDRTQTTLSGGLLEGIKEDGSRTWKGASGTWKLDIAGVEIRWVDPVPQAGRYTLTTPTGKELVLSFARVDGDTIRVTIASGRKSLSLDVSSLGGISG